MDNFASNFYQIEKWELIRTRRVVPVGAWRGHITDSL